MQAKSFIQSNWFVLILVFLLGWCTYSLKLVSIIKLLGELDFRLYPLLMLMQGISFFASMKLMTKVSERNEKTFYFISLVAGFVLVFFTSTQELNSWATDRWGWLYSFSVFLLSSFIVLAIEITTRLLVVSKLSLLENPKAATQVNFTMELGVILGASMTLSVVHTAELLPIYFLPVASALPFVVALACLLILTRQGHEVAAKFRNPSIQNALDLHAVNLHKNMRSYLYSLVTLIAIVLVCKQLQGFAVFMGLKAWQENTQSSIATIFSILALIQNGLILVFIIPSFFTRNRSTIWTSGFNYYFYCQVACMFFIAIFPFAAALIGTGVVRKITQRAFLNQSLNMLVASIPKLVRFQVKSDTQKYGNLVAFVVLALLSFLAINDFISFTFVWFLAGVFSLMGLWVLRQVLRKLNAFHLNNIVEYKSCPFNVYEAVNSCYALANKDAAKYYPDISQLLNAQNTRLIVKKALIHAMGELKNKAAPGYLMALFNQFPREDVQLEILRALSKYPNLEIENFLQTVLKKTMYYDTRRGDLKISFCEVIAKRMPQPTISLATQVIESNPSDKRIVGNAIDVLGEIATRVRSRKIFDYLARFLAPDYPRRIRINAIKHLYHVKAHRQVINEIILGVHNSTRLEDQCGAAYLYGILGIYDHLAFIQTLNEKTRHRNSTVLLSLLRLNQTGVEIDIINLMREATPEQAQIYINQLYRVRDEKLRYRVYFALLQYYPENVNDILHLLRDSLKNFDRDRAVIIEEAERLGIPIADDLLYQV